MSNSFPAFDGNRPARYPTAKSAFTTSGPAPAPDPLDCNPIWRYVTFSVFVSISTIALTALTVAVHFTVRTAEFSLWWTLLLFLLLVSLGMLWAAACNLPRKASAQRNWATNRLAHSLAIWLAAVTFYALAFPPMSFILYMKSPAGQQAAAQARAQQKLLRQQQEVAAQQRASFEAQYQREMNELSNQIHFAKNSPSVRQTDLMVDAFITRIAKAEAKQAEEKLANQKFEYRSALHDRLTKFDPQQPLPKYNGEEFDWRFATPIEFKSATFASDAASPAVLIEDQSSADGMQILRLKLTGAQFIPKLALFSGKKLSQPLLVLVRRSGDELEISTADWKLQRTTYFAGQCVDLAYSQDTLHVAQEIPGAIVSARKRSDGSSYHSTGRILAPQQITASRHHGNEVTTAVSIPLWAKWSDGGAVRQIQELSQAREPAATSRFLPSQLGRNTFVSANREIYVAQKDGIYRGQLPVAAPPRQRPYYPSDRHCGYVSLDGREFLAHDSHWPVNEIAWTKVLPAAGIDIEKFSTISGDYLATCNDTHNLLLYDTTGKLHSQHNWPGAGKTLGLAGMLESPHLLVFTEQKVFVVTPAGAKAAVELAKPEVQTGRANDYPLFAPAIGDRKLATAELATQSEKVSTPVVGGAFGVSGEGCTANVYSTSKLRFFNWGQDVRDQYAVNGALIYKISSMYAIRQIDLANGSSRKKPKPADYISHFALSKSRVIAIVPELQQLVTADHKDLNFANSFQIPEFPTKNGRLATSLQVDWVALTQETEGAARIDLIDVRNGQQLLTIPGADLQPPVKQFEQVVIGLNGNALGVCANGHFYWLQLTGTSFKQTYATPLKDLSAVKLHSVPAKSMIFAVDGSTLRRFDATGPVHGNIELKVERPINIAIEPSGDFYWSDEMKKYDLTGVVNLGVPLTNPGAVVLSPDRKRILVGDQFIEIFFR